MAAANYVQYVLRNTITAATGVFGPAAPVAVTVETIPGSEVQQDGPES
jgi:hypothetical protein